MEINSKLKKRFVKDFSLPIPIVEEPYFTYFVDLYDDLLDTHKKLDMMRDYASKFDTADALISHYENFKTMSSKILNQVPYITYLRMI